MNGSSPSAPCHPSPIQKPSPTSRRSSPTIPNKMTSEIATLLPKGLPAKMADALELYLETGDEAVARGAAMILPGNCWQELQFGGAVISSCRWNETTRSILRFFILRDDTLKGNVSADDHVLVGALHQLHNPEQRGNPALVGEAVEDIRALHGFPEALSLTYLDNTFYKCDWALDPSGSADAPFLSPVSNLIYGGLPAVCSGIMDEITEHYGILGGLALHRPEMTREWCGKSIQWGYRGRHGWRAITEATDGYDQLCLEYCRVMRGSDAGNAFLTLEHLNRIRGGIHQELLLEVASEPRAALRHDALELLLKHRRNETIPIMIRAFEDPESRGHISHFPGESYGELFKMACDGWDAGGEELIRLAMQRVEGQWFSVLVAEHIPELDPSKHAVFRREFLEQLGGVAPRDLPDHWKLVSGKHAAAFMDDFEPMLSGKSKAPRELAAGVLIEKRGTDFAPQALSLLGSKKADARLGGTAFFARLGDATWLPQLAAAAETETSEVVRDALHEAMKACGQLPAASSSGTISDPSEFVASACKQAAKLKLPASPWFNRDSLPPLHLADGAVVPPEAITFLIARQAKQKDPGAAPEILPLLAVIDRKGSVTFANALVEGFLDSDQAASDRWALMLGGLLGDNRIITLLLPRINDWCENSRHKLAEYAAQAISLLPGNEPLMVLDTLSNRYRSKFKNVGKACAEAFNAAATARGITTDELGDLVVPDFGFDAEGVRRFEWDGGGASAELGADFKLSWFDPETDKAWKALPAAAPDAVKEEVKTLGKLLREAVKAQNARLEMMLVRQRRWPVARWRELFENHPLLRSFASNLVWGVYDSGGNLLRTFRRYANGLLADAGGALEELPEADTVVGMVHPLELEKETTDAWRAHLARFKMKPPFLQLDRPVERVDPLHGNRREVTTARDKQLSAGTFRSRAEKRGWLRGSVVDAGGITSYYKVYPGAGIEVILQTENLWIGCDPMETVTLGGAWFVKADSVQRGSYTYDEPKADDPRVLRFDQVPAVVWSETIGDLKAIVATKE
ncbi:MAG: DUF4132 domain-containing protein [Verrucomicrobiaceae bacterium]|nr:MAG: DUF4132 domain-containing protein [Verrucomicrobiaceae bacterium]